MKIGITSFIFYDWDLEKICKYVSNLGYEAIELDIRPGQKHIQLSELFTGKAREIKSLIEKHNLMISALSCGVNHLDPDLKRRKELNDYFKQVIEAASLLEVPVVTGISGFPIPEMTEEQNWREFEHEMGAIIDVASKKEVKVAIETFPPALVYNNSTIEKMISLIPSKYLGWNLDPSHQVYQFIDYFESIRTFKDRIFHVHAKDAEILYDRLRFTGIHGKE
jgi:sugar phosphate isomerase/epimerase